MTLQGMHLVLNLIVKDIYEIESMKKVTFLPVMGLFGYTFNCTYLCTHRLKETTFLIQSEVFSNFTGAFLVPATIYLPGLDRVAIALYKWPYFCFKRPYDIFYRV